VSASPAISAWQSAFAAQPHSAAQQTAFDRFLQRGLPTPRDDAFKYTDFRRLAARNFQLPAATDHLTSAAQLLTEAAWHYLVFVDGKHSATLSSAMPSGVKVTQGGIAPTSASFDLLNAALNESETVIDIAATEQVKQPICIAHIWSNAAAEWMRHPRIAIRIAPTVNITLIEHFVSAQGGQCFSNAVTTIDVADGAQVTHLTLQEDGASNFHIANLRVNVAHEARYAHHHYALGSALARTDIHATLHGERAHVELSGLVFARETQHLDVRTCVEHQVPNTTSDEEYRGIADHRGRVVFNGKVIVAKDAQKTDARQSSRNLLLSPTAEVDTRPELEIYANDVKCAHGATIGQLDETALFYLRSRGIDLQTARTLLTQAFAASILSRTTLQPIRDRILAGIALRLHTPQESL
jgi:Fe-S cluster assembly protein SufD